MDSYDLLIMFLFHKFRGMLSDICRRREEDISTRPYEDRSERWECIKIMRNYRNIRILKCIIMQPLKVGKGAMFNSWYSLQGITT
jgi:hypothetical protein